jgi:hypothetical protein
MAEHKIVCNCGNVIDYSSNVNEVKTISCSKCNKQIKVINYGSYVEVVFYG